MFELTRQTAVLSKLTTRTENHGDDDVPAVSLRFTITGSNTLLDLMARGLLDLFYKPAEEPESQQQIEGTELTSKPKLRLPGIDTVTFRGALEGWTCRVDYGLDDTSAIVMGNCKVDGFAIDELLEGGSATWSLRVGTSDVGEIAFGKLCLLQKREVTLSITGPKAKAADQQSIDGTVGAFLADHPNAAQGDMLKAGPQDESDSEGGEPDATDAFVAAHGKTDDAEFEEGVKAGLAKRGVRPKKPAAKTANKRKAVAA